MDPYEYLLRVFQVAVPLIGGIVTTYGTIVVAKINNLRKDMKTNHGSRNIGEAVDMINEKVDILSSNQAEISSALRLLRTTDTMLRERMDTLESRNDLLLDKMEDLTRKDIK